MTPVKSLADDGSYIDTTECQISLAHAMSLDHETRAENTVDVSLFHTPWRSQD